MIISGFKTLHTYPRKLLRYFSFRSRLTSAPIRSLYRKKCPDPISQQIHNLSFILNVFASNILSQAAPLFKLFYTLLIFCLLLYKTVVIAIGTAEFSAQLCLILLRRSPFIWNQLTFQLLICIRLCKIIPDTVPSSMQQTGSYRRS